MSESKDEKAGKMVVILNNLYNRASAGVVGSKSVPELAEEYLSEADGDIEEAARRLIAMQKLKCATSGAISGLGGFATTCVLLPANVVNVLYVQMRMIMALAYMGGADLNSDRVQTTIYLCLAGEPVEAALKNIGVQVGSKLATQAIQAVPVEVLKRLNKFLGMKLVTKFGHKGIINLGKMVPLVGAAVGGAIDYKSTDAIAKLAYSEFITHRTPKGAAAE